LLTLIQTGKIKPLPILLFGSDYWNRVVNFEALVEEGVVSARDLDLFKLVETAEEGWSYVCDHYLGTDQMPDCVA
jgi:predicted Rossmann-fold nucleotide-binding protein